MPALPYSDLDRNPGPWFPKSLVIFRVQVVGCRFSDQS